MQTFITTTLADIDSAIGSYAQNVFESVGGPIQTLILAAGVMSLAIIAANSMMQFQPMRMGSFVTWAVRYVLVLSVATTWAQFSVIFDILTNVPDSYGGLLLGATGITGSTAGLNDSMDQMVTNVFALADTANSNTSFIGISITGVLLGVLGAIMATVAILVSAIAKIGLALAVGLAPLAIASMMFRGTSQLFESWSRFTLGFAMIPLVLAGIMGAIIGIGTGLVTGGTATAISEIAGFLIVTLAAIFMMYSVPTLSSGLAGSIVAAAGAGFVAAGIGSAIGLARGAASNTVGAGQRAFAGVREGRFAAESGGISRDIWRARFAGATASSHNRESRLNQFRLDDLAKNGRASRTANAQSRTNSGGGSLSGDTPATAPSGAELAAKAAAAADASRGSSSSNQTNNIRNASLATGSRRAF